MKLLLILPMLALLPWCASASEGRPYFNDLKAPESRKDLEAIQKSLTAALPKARAATVCIELKDGSGSGVIVSPDGLILTAAHVATGVKKKVTVELEDGTKLKAETLGLVADKDAAMIRITEPGTYPFVEMDRAATTLLGDWVFALGHSGGFNKERGSVVRIGRLVRIAGSSFQSDCTLIGGDSGGPLFDMTGKLVGIHSRVGAQLQVNMHVPMAEFISNWDGMMKGEFIGEGPYAQLPVKGNGFLGLATEPNPKGGLRITKVGSRSPAEEAGVKEGDILHKLNGTEMKTREQMQDLLGEMSAGDELTLDMERGGKPKTFTLELGER
ncbi:trypsin-like peptidase domain-containing protein [Luteolibacter yonseiensis]|uniref:Trypsin-like peptidase domain-containing protein n=1 Tax=Luteolibacter yonseiensis TaxID=1144680 RepID=A0A934R2F6_9BACT|nr:trypsin-like peptidase domain-containing protein [Luteolibacter yonseiensis]MBK1815577.1 trypsin-like peptidase domain-containing protein [Luteolibacter yonseiensis]